MYTTNEEVPMEREVTITEHTTCGYEYEISDAKTGLSLSGRMFWCDEDEEDEDIRFGGFAYHRAKCAKNGLKVVEEVWS
jgi:hypothetical protein